MPKEISKQDVILILDWCKSKFGRSKYMYDYPEIVVYTKKKSKENYAYYRETDNKIRIFLEDIHTKLKLCEIFLHEYKHYLQNNNEYEAIEKQMLKKGYQKNDIYDNHPHEKKCFKFASKWKNDCYIGTFK